MLDYLRSEVVELNASNLEDVVVLAHTDYLVDVAERRSRGDVRIMEKYHLPTLRKGGVNIICDHVGGETRMFSTFPLAKLLTNADHLERALNGIDCMIQEADESSNVISIVTTIKDVETIKKSNRLGIILCLQGGTPIKRDLSLLRTFYRLGIRCMHLTANSRNQISDSCMDRTNGGLSDFGVSVVEEMNRLGIVIDIAHLSPQGNRDVLSLTKEPIIASNSNARALCGHPRNLDDEVIKLLGENRGVMGIHCLPAFLRDDGQASIEDMIKHIDYATNLIGVDHVGLGPDLLENWPKEKYDHIWGEGQNLGNQKIKFDYPQGFQSIADIPKLRDLLLSHGYSENDVSKILGGNFLRVFRDVWK